MIGSADFGKVAFTSLNRLTGYRESDNIKIQTNRRFE